MAAVGILLFAAAGFVTTLPGFPLPISYPVWVVWVLRLAPLPALVILWAVAHEAESKVSADDSAIHFRQALGQTLRVPWREVTDYFADCGRSPRDVATSGGSLVHDAADVGLTPHPPPFASYGPDYTLVSNRGSFVFDDSLSNVGALAEVVSSNAPEGTPKAWEEASWVTCRGCDGRTAASFWPLSPADRVRYCDRCRAPSAQHAEGSSPAACTCGGEFVLEEFLCPACGEPYGSLLPSGEQAFIVERRGAMQHPRPWRLASGVPGAAEEPEPAEGDEDDARP